MAGTRRSSAESITSPRLPLLDTTRFVDWTAAVINYLRAVNKDTDWFADHEGARLFCLAQRGNYKAKFETIEKQLSSLLIAKNPKDLFDTSLLDTFEQHVLFHLPQWQKAIWKLSTPELTRAELGKIHSPEEKRIITYFPIGKTILDAFCAPIEQSADWPVLLKELSEKFSDKHLEAVKYVIRHSILYFILMAWRDQYMPRLGNDAAGTKADERNAMRGAILQPLVLALHGAFSDAPKFLGDLLDECIREKDRKNAQMITEKIIFINELEEPVLSLMYEKEEITLLKQLQEKIKGRKTETDEVDEKKFATSTPAPESVVSPRPRTGSSSTPLPASSRPRTGSTPQPIRLQLMSASSSPLFQRLKETINSDDEAKSAEKSKIKGPNQ